LPTDSLVVVYNLRLCLLQNTAENNQTPFAVHCSLTELQFKTHASWQKDSRLTSLIRIPLDKDVIKRFHLLTMNY